MALTHTLTGNIVDLVGAPFNVDDAAAYLEASNPAYVDAGTAVRLGPTTTIDLAADGDFTLPGIPDSTSATQMYRVVITYLPTSDSRRATYQSGWFNLLSDARLDQLVTVTPTTVDPDFETRIAGITEAIGQPSKALAPWFAALAGSETTAAKVLVIGPSILEGTGASTWPKRLLSRLTDSLRGRYPAVTRPGAGYIPCAVATGPNPPVTTTGSPTRLDGDFGLGMKTLQITSGKSVSWSGYCDRIRIWYSRDPFGGPADIKINGTLVTTLTSNGANDAQQWDSGALTPAWRTISIEGTTAFAFFADGIEIFNGDWDKGVTVYDGTHYGYSTANYLTSQAIRGHWKSVADLDPHLTIIDLTANENGRPPAQTIANLQSIISQLNSVVDPVKHSILIVVGYRPPGRFTDADWAELRAGYRGLASGNVEVFDVTGSWPDLVADGSNNLGLMLETTNPLHLSDAGQRFYADLLLAKIAGRVTPKTDVTASRVQDSTVLAADVVNNNAVANTIADVTGLSFPVTAGKKYRFRFEIAYDAAAATTGSRWSINGPGGTMRYRSEYSLTTTSRTINDGLSAHDTPAAASATSAATGSNIAIVEGFYEASASGYVIARFASEVAGSAITAKAGSVCYFHEVL